MCLKIGSSYIFDSTGSTSTTPNKAAGTAIRFAFDHTEGREEYADALRWREGTEGAEIAFWVFIDGDSYANMILARDDVMDVVREIKADVTLEDAADTTYRLFSVSDSTFASARGTTVVHNTGLSCAIYCVLTFTTYEPNATSGGTPIDGLVGTLQAAVQRGGFGGLAARISATFRGDGDDSPLTKAQEWVNSVKTRTSSLEGLSWLPAKTVMRIIDEEFAPLEPQTEITGGTVTATITLLEMNSALVDLIEQIRQADYTVDVIPRKAQTEAGSRARGYQVNATVSMTVKTERNTDFDAVDDAGNTITGDLTSEQMSTALALIWTEVKAQVVAQVNAVTQWKIMDMNMRPAATNGRYEIAIDAIASTGSGNIVLSYSSTLAATTSANATILTDTEGSDIVYRNRRPRTTIVAHRLHIQQLGNKPEYVRPGGFNSWELTDFDEETPTSGLQNEALRTGILDEAGAYAIYNVAYTAVYRLTGSRGANPSVAGIQLDRLHTLVGKGTFDGDGFGAGISKQPTGEASDGGTVKGG
ncbi:MAG: hypothetical protein KDB07_12760 [Planctomycetes bacterium]|nr:hypothetical protein [Planctomycetota bacterium]